LKVTSIVKQNYSSKWTNIMKRGVHFMLLVF